MASLSVPFIQTAEWAIHVVRQALDQLLEAGSGSDRSEKGVGKIQGVGTVQDVGTILNWPYAL